MDICIKNYKNLKDLCYSISNNKINFLFGLSGSGKSSVLGALCADDIAEGKTFGSRESDVQIAEIDGNAVSPTEMHVFDTSKVQFIYSDYDIEPISEVIISDPTEHDAIHKKLEDKLEDLNIVLAGERSIYEEINKFLQDLKIKKLTKTNAIPATSIYSKALTNLKSLSAKKMFSNVCSMDDTYVKWIADGIDFIQDKKCPFCLKKMSKSRISKNGKFKNFDSNNIANLKKELNAHAALFADTISFQYSKLKNMEKEIISYARAAETYYRISEQIHSTFDLDYESKSFKMVDLNPDFSKYFPNTCREYKKLCKNLPKLKDAIEQTHIDTDNFLKNKKGIVNDLLERIGIPYHFEVQYQRSGPNSYYIIHNDNTDGDDNRNSLSEGEKSIVILVLFLVAASKTNYKLYMIDDPVSSFDSLRRKFIYDVINKYLAGKTVIVFSHDSVFAKFALEDKTNKKIGDITYLSNDGKNPANLIQLKGKSLSSFEKSVVNRMSAATNQYQKAVLSRLLIEDELGTSSRKYGYLSRILHGTPYNEIMTFLGNVRINEGDLLNDINHFLESKGASPNYLSPLLPTYNTVDISSFSVFEKSIIIRELINKGMMTASPFIREELNNYVHLADMLDIIVDPFEFPMISRSLSDYVLSLGNTYTL